LSTALAGRDLVAVESACDLGEAGSLLVFAADAGDDLGWECRLASGWRRAPSRHPRFFSPLGEVALELADWDQPCAPLGLHGRDRRHDAPVERGEADAERLRCLLARVHESFDRCGELAVLRRQTADGPRGMPLLLLPSASLPALGHRYRRRLHRTAMLRLICIE
jgi:hypothetical protein